MDEPTAPFAAEELVPSQELRVRTKFQIAAKSDLGRVRENNEDKYEFYVPSDDAVLAARGSLFVVCDGMGGAEAGQIASELCCKTYIDAYFHSPASEPEAAMRGGVRAACRFVMDVGRAMPQRKGMGTTLSSLILLQDAAYIVHVGDSRIYRLRQGELLQLTHDHTWCDEMIALGKLTPEDAVNHPYRHVITRAVSTDTEVEPDVTKFDLAVGDTFMLCSDGLVNHVSDPEIQTVLLEEGPSEAVWKLVGLALQGGGSDNTTVMVVKVQAIDAVSESLDAIPTPEFSEN